MALVKLRVLDLLGREVARQPLPVHPGANELPLMLPGLRPGIYQLLLLRRRLPG